MNILGKIKDFFTGNVKEEFNNKNALDEYNTKLKKYKMNSDTLCESGTQQDIDRFKREITFDKEEMTKKIDEITNCLENVNDANCNLYKQHDYKRTVNREATSQGIMMYSVNDANTLINENLILLGIITSMIYLLTNHSSVKRDNITGQLNSAGSYIKGFTKTNLSTSDYLHSMVKN